MKLVPIDPLRPWMGLKPDLPDESGPAPTWLKVILVLFLVSLIVGWLY